MNIHMIPLNRLVPCLANVRKTGTGIGIEELAASIAAHGLLQHLQVRAGKGGKFKVAAGGRCLPALQLLARQKTLSKLAEIGCNVLDDDEDPGEISLAENSNREAMHPADSSPATPTKTFPSSLIPPATKHLRPGQDHQRGDGCVITSTNGCHSTHHTSRYAIPDKFTVPLGLQI
jgi:ParB-like nuclease family protein